MGLVVVVTPYEPGSQYALFLFVYDPGSNSSFVYAPVVVTLHEPFFRLSSVTSALFDLYSSTQRIRRGIFSLNSTTSKT